MNSLLTIALKDLRLLWRDKASIFWVIIFPLGMAILFGTLFGGGGGRRGAISVAFLDQDQSPSSAQFAEKLLAGKAVEFADPGPATVEDARDAVRRGRVTAFIIVRPGFGDTVPFFGDSGQVLEVGMDPARQAEAGMLQGLLMQSTMETLFGRFMDKDWARGELRKSLGELDSDRSLGLLEKAALRRFLTSLDSFLGDASFDAFSAGEGGPSFAMDPSQFVAMEEVNREVKGTPRSPFQISFPSGIMWGIVACVSAFAISLVQERKQGTLLRLRVSPLGEGRLLLGKGLACFLQSLAVMVFLFAVGKVFFKMTFSDPAKLLAAMLATATFFTGLMMMISAIGKTEQAVAGAGWGIMMIFMMFGGGMIPLFAMPKFMTTLSTASPVKWAILGMEGAIWRDFSWGEMVLPIVIQLVGGVVLYLIGVRLFQRQGG